MGASIEILPTKPLSSGWEQQLREYLALLDNSIRFDQIAEHSFRVIVRQSALFDAWLAVKEPDVFKDEDYLDELKGLEKMDVPLFLELFRKISYSIRLEMKTGADDRELQLMVTVAKELAQLTNGIILFDHTIGTFVHDHVYVLSDFE